MIGVFIFLFTIGLLVLNYINSNSEFKFLSEHNRKSLIKRKKLLALIFSSLIAILVFLDWFSNNSDLNALKEGQSNILQEITLTERKKDSIVHFYTSRLDVKGEELMIARQTIKKLLNQLDHYNKSTDEVIKQSYNLFLVGEFEEAIDLLEIYAESATEKRLISIYILKKDLLTAQARFPEALNYAEKLYYLEPDIESKFDYAALLFLNDELTEAFEHFIEIHNELIKDSSPQENNTVLRSQSLFYLYYYIGRINAFYGNYANAIQSYYKADKYLREYKGVSRNFYTLMLINAIGINFYYAKDYNKAEEILTDLVNSFKNFECVENHCVNLKALAYSNLANTIRVGRKDYKLALKYLILSEDFLMKMNSNSTDFLYEISSLGFNKGMTYKGLRKYDQAEQNFKKSIKLIPANSDYKKHDFIILKLTSHFQLAELYNLTGEKNKSLESYTTSLELINNYIKENSESNSLLKLKDEIEKAITELRKG